MKSAEISAFTYRIQAVRDLAWACFSRPLLQIGRLDDDGHNAADCALDPTPARLNWLDRLERRPDPLLANLARSSDPRLGLYFERLWHFFLEQDPVVDLVAHNLAVHDSGRTLGEFDVIYWCHERQRHVHLELAVKFFLGCRQHTGKEARSHWHEWLGPDSRDRLDLKLKQLLRRQIRLGEHPLARQQLASRGIADPAREIAVRGYLFQRHDDPLPPPLGFDSQMAQWLPLDDLSPYLRGLEEEYFMLLPKKHWLAPARVDAQAQLISRSMLTERLQSLLADNGRARLVAGMGADGSEKRRFFVTANDWPAAQKHSTQETP